MIYARALGIPLDPTSAIAQFDPSQEAPPRYRPGQ